MRSHRDSQVLSGSVRRRGTSDVRGVVDARVAASRAVGTGRGVITAETVLALQRTAGNAATATLLTGVRDDARRDTAMRDGPIVQREVVQRLSGFTVTALDAAGATPVPGAVGTFVAPRGTVVTGTATVVSATGAALPANAVRWSGGRAGSSQLERLVRGSPRSIRLRARVGGSSRTITIFIADAVAPPGPMPAATLQHRQIGASKPGTDFGLTVVTIGSQGVKGPEFTVTAFLSSAQWSFAVTRIRHGFKLGVKSQGRRDIPNAGAVSTRRAGVVIADLTPPVTPNGPPRARFWVRSISLAHEHAHRDHFYLPAHGFWPPAMNNFEAAVAGATVNFDPATARRAAQVIAAQRPGWRAAIDAQHDAADAAEIGGAEIFCHGRTNPMYTTLIAGIRATVRPPAPTGLAATATGSATATLGWAQDTALVTSFVLERRTGRGPWAVVAPALPATTVAHTDVGLTPGTRYTYRLSAQGAAGGSTVRTLRVRTTP